MNPDFADEKLIRDYLLGRLPEPQQDEIEDRLLTDHALEEMVTVVEDEIIDEYLDAPQAHADRQAIESYFLRPPQRRDKLAFAQSLRQRLGNEPRTTGSGSGSSLPNPPFHLMSAGAGVAWLMLLIVMTGSGLYITKLRQDLRSETTRNREIQTTLQAQLALEKERADGLQKKVEALQTPNQTQPGPQKTFTAMLDLRPMDRGTAAVPRVNLAATTQWLEAHVGLDGTPPPKSCSIAVNSANGAHIWSQIDRTPCTQRGSSVLTFRIPARGLSPGDYSVVITQQWDGPKGSKKYYFSVAR